jgi:phosphatidylglycerophosphatase A
MLPVPGYFVSRHHWFLSLGILALFRLFDIWKPWPVRQSQSLPGGWGVTVDDVLASLYVAALVLVIGIWHG